MTFVNNEFLLYVRELRIAKKLTQQQMADALKIYKSTYVKKELGLFPFDLSEIVVIARLFDMSVSELVIPLSPTLSEVYHPLTNERQPLLPSQPNSDELDDYKLRSNWSFDVR